MNPLNEPNELEKTGCYQTDVKMKHESRRYNAANETSKEFYIRRTDEMKRIIESDGWKYVTDKWWKEYKEANTNKKID